MAGMRGMWWLSVVVGVATAQVNVGNTIDIEECQSGECATLYFYDSQGREVHSEFDDVSKIRHHGKLGVRDVAKVRQVGAGCFRIFNRANYRGDQFEVTGTDYHDLRHLGWTSLAKAIK